jgi:serine/threonine-protein kinase
MRANSQPSERYPTMSYGAHFAPTLAQSAAAAAFDATRVAPSAPSGVHAFEAPVSAARTTVLPRVDGDGTRVQLSLEPRSRYEPTKLLGAGGMGEVVLVDDHDIQRKVALKRLLPDSTDPALLARFVDEIRCVGRLEHPNIVPIHDVGVDELGRYFFVMKYVEGETLERIIERLAAGDPAYVAKYSVEVRVEIFLGLLHALAYAHERGIVHRDVKPANVMVGRFGEVVLMDWGVAKPLGAARDAARGADASLVAGGAGEGERARMYTTRVGALVGTPAYMSPEQARGDVSAVDARSDLYSAVVLFHELLGLRHYLADAGTLEAVLDGVVSERFGFRRLVGLPYPGDVPPAEYIHVFVKGLAKDPAQRFQSAGELIARLHAIFEGRVPVQCPITATKRSYRELGRVVDHRPLAGMAMLLGILAAVVFAGIQLVRIALA